MPKRKSALDEEPVVAPARRRSARLQDAPDATAATTEPKIGGGKSKPSTKKSTVKRILKTEQSDSDPEPPIKKGRPQKQPAATKKTSPTDEKPKSAAASNGPADAKAERNYWLLKAEPESRFENGVDVKFSIDDLAARTEPEPWDGIRAYAARNNLRAMKQGELAFFYHSNCKEPGIAGTMEIVQEHSPDLSAHDPKAPYYDPKSNPADPKWSVVHVKFRSKFAVPIGLKELREMGGPGKPLENMQMLKQSRLSVSKVSAAEWEYLMGVAEERASQK
ncbi:hypothetical protein C8A01DRAFT_49309 [Parachaetomium inaequale]|uniref:Thymocyte nuclear protein 1 n=1 Tax=Parachaetomium inaequale TaxID=2588326 RepID=A0AAN6PB94_9PEZI|nr:hypothetical protein C8A01DRAFT_49309 [Parachaetomium inaequale]